MSYVEDDQNIRAGYWNDTILKYFYDYNFFTERGKGKFRFVFDQGALKCGYEHKEYKICQVSKGKQNNINRDKNSFVYLDCGCWVDNSDGNNTKRRDFGLVCGDNVYLCKFYGDRSASKSKILSVQNFFKEMALNNCGCRVERYARATQPLNEFTPKDTDLYIILGDLHLPPIKWFFDSNVISVHAVQGPITNPPMWLYETTAMKRQHPNYLLRNYYSFSQLWQREHKQPKHAEGPISGNPDIFRAAGDDLVKFLNGLSDLSKQTKSRLHFIQTGDMFEMWVGREYQYKTIDSDRFSLKGSLHRVEDWALEVMMKNITVFESFIKLQNSGIKEVTFLWGNHDAYLSNPNVTNDLNLPKRSSVYVGLKNDLYVEHGHRFDKANFDEVEGGFTDGPNLTNLTYWVPPVRKIEPQARGLASFFTQDPEFRKITMLGATLIYLYQKYDENKNPLSIYVIGHTHEAMLTHVPIKIDYHLYEIK
jgi:UDP-2,3-diacylglucosamine pyrophosphatase LpxH